MRLYTLIEQKEKEAREYATQQHKKQKRKSGEPYIKHPERVAELVRKYKSSSKIDDLVSAALLHDTIEDTNTTEKDLKKLFGGLVASLVKELTSDKEEIKKTSKSEYLTDKMTGMSSWALVIKLADRLDNVSDLKTADEKFASRYKKETENMLNSLEKRRILTDTQKKIAKAIREKLEELNENVMNEDLGDILRKVFGIKKKDEEEKSEEDKEFEEKIKEKVGPKPSEEDFLALKYQAALDKFDPDYEHLRIMVEKAKDERVDPSLVIALVTQESSFREKAKNYNRNGTTDYGYFQLNDRWHKQHKSNIERHIETGIKHLKWCLDTANGNETRALSRYNTGSETNSIGQAYARKVLSIKRKLDSSIKRVSLIHKKIKMGILT